MALMLVTMTLPQLVLAGSLEEETALIGSDTASGDRFGASVDVATGDTDTLVVGAPSDDDHGTSSGSAYVFVRSGGTWSQQAKLSASDAEAGDLFGTSVAIKSDGEKIIVGAPQGGDGFNDTGAAYIFTRSGTDWTEQTKLLPNTPTLNGSFGHSVDIDRGTALVGEPDGKVDGERIGSAYVFKGSGSNWNQQARLAHTTGSVSPASQGTSVALHHHTAVLGDDIATGEDGTVHGAAYVFERSGSTWEEVATLTPPNPSFNDQFGEDVAVDSSRIAVGAYFDDALGDDAGAVYTFIEDGTGWSFEGQITASDGEAHDNFGRSVSIEGDALVVGAPHADGASGTTGVGYLFDHTSTGWTELGTLQASDGAFLDQLGISTSLHNGTAALGAPGADEAGSDSGEVDIFDLIPGQPRNLTAALGSQDDEVVLDWDPPSDETYLSLDSYLVKRAEEDAGTFETIAQVPATQTSYTDTGLSEGTYRYVVTAENTGGEGPASEEATVSITPPGPPQDLTATSFSDDVELDWNPPDPDTYTELTAYWVYRSSDGQAGPFTKIAEVHPDQTSHTDHDVDDGTYHYAVTAENAVGESDRSDTASATVQGAPGAAEDTTDETQDDGGSGGDASDDVEDPTPLSQGGQTHTFTGTLIPGIDTLDAYGQTLTVTETSQLCYEIDPQPTLDLRLRLLDPNLSPVAVSDVGGLGAVETVCAGSPGGPALEEGQWVLAVETVGLSQTQGTNPTMDPSLGLFDYFGERRCDPNC